MTDLPEWLPGQWDHAYSSVSQGGRTMYLPTNLGSLSAPFATSLTFTQGSPTFDHSGGPVPPGKGKVTIKDGVVHLEIPVPATIAPSLPATIAKTPEGLVISLDVPAGGGGPSVKVYYARAQEQPRAKLPEWLPGQWDLAHHTMTMGGRTTDFPAGAGGIQIATWLTFTQGSPTYEYSGGPVPLVEGKGKVTVKDGVVSIEIWPMIAPPLPATIAKTPEGMVVSFSLPIPGGRPTEYKAYYTRAAEESRAKLPEWLPGQWDLAHHTMTMGGRTSDFPAGTGVIQIATSLTFMQGSPNYEYSGGPVPLGKGKVTVKDGVVNIGLWPTNVLSLPAMVAKTPEGIVVNFSHTIYSGGPSEFKVYYTRAQ
ncbi:MAG: hypothetical protein JO075_12055 [Acidimicrobiia bacterium]|nr:hypothetical protein [Acidimicrobiia bacterium]